MPEQLTLRFDPREHQSRADFHVGAANRAAVEAVDRWPDWPSRVLVLVGPEASGKSHLAAILATEHQAQIHDATTVDWHSVAAGLATVPPGTLIVVENAGAGIDEAGLFHLINAVTSANGWLLLTARSLPGEWSTSLPDLISRLRAATPIVIGPPDDALLENIIAKHFADRQTVVDPTVIRYSIPRMERSYAAALDLVDRLDGAALVRKSAITRALAADVLGASADQPQPPGLDDDDSPDEKPS